ncbi:MAG: 50S ribosomal protein L22 [Ignavibacteriae bacterium]|nr:MAG: 50S ribosomal protein L22 [Ignavibacteriota bacterium]
MEAKAINRYIGTSPRKMRLVIDLIRGKAVEEALSILHFTTKAAAKTAEQVLRSAISNVQNKEESGRVDTATLYVKEAFVNGGAMAKRVLPAPMGRAFRVRKRSNHITIVVAQREQAKAAVPKAKAVTGAKKTETKKSEPASATKEVTES